MIRERSPLEIAEQSMPYIQEPVVCLDCNKEWVTLRPVGMDYRFLECPWCHQQNSELAHEAPRFSPVKQ